MQEIYSYRLPGRRLSIWAALACTVFLCTLALYETAPWFIWAIWLPSAGMVLYLLIKNPVVGVRLMSDRLILSAWQKPRDVFLKDIARIEFINWSDSTDMELHLNNSDIIRVFSGDIPPKEPFIAQLKRLGLEVIER